MALLIDIRLPEWMTDAELEAILAPLLPGVRIQCGIDGGALDDIVMAAVVGLHPGMAARLPKLALVQKLGAGVESIVAAPDLPSHVRVARLAPDASAREIAEYCLAYVLQGQRNMAHHRAQQLARRWSPIAPRQSAHTTVGVLGLGLIGGRTARCFASLGFRVLGWSRSAKTMAGVDCRAGMAALPGLLAECDYVCCILPSTPATRGLFDTALLSTMKPDAVLINAGRGDLIVDEDLIGALDAGPLGSAVLDVFQEEPLPIGHPFWTHPKVTLTPHVSGWHLDDALRDVAENYRRLVAGQPLLHEVDRETGY